MLRDQHFLAETPAVFLKSIMALHVGGHESNIFPMDMAISRFSDFAILVYTLFFLGLHDYLSRDMRFPTMWYVRPACLRIRAV